MAIVQSVPDQLSDELLDAANRWSNDLHGLAYAAAFKIIRFHLGADWAIANVRLTAEPNQFMLNELDEASNNRFTHMTRVTRLADALFVLSGSDGFQELVRRFQSRDTRPCYYEAQIAAEFVRRGFTVVIRPERGQRGQDFDFAATHANETINIEVTARVGGKPSEKAFYDTLHDKRTQLPPDGPSILFVYLPETWSVDEAGMAEAIRAGCDRFFRGSLRINVIVALWEVLLPLGKGMIAAEVYHPLFHPSPRRKTNNLSFLLDLRLENSVQAVRKMIGAQPGVVQSRLAMQPFNPPVEYLEWISSRLSSRGVTGHKPKS